MKNYHSNDGYIFLISVLVIGAIASAIVISLLLLGLAAERSGLALQQSSQALAMGELCAEYALISLHDDAGYTGNESISRAYGDCEILEIGGSGNENRSVCIEGISGASTRRFEIIIDKIIPSIQVYSWQEVESITACSY